MLSGEIRYGAPGSLVHAGSPETAGRGTAYQTWADGMAGYFTGPSWPLGWMATLLLLYVAGTLPRPYLPNYGAVYCYVWTDYCLRR